MSPEAFAVTAAQVEAELRKLIVGQDEVVRDTMVAATGRGARAPRGGARAGEDVPRPCPRAKCSTWPSAASSSRPT